MRSCIARGAIVAALLLGTGGVGAQETANQRDIIPDREWEARCLLTGRLFYRLGEQRKGGADRTAAVFRVSQWVAQHGDVGSHVRFDFTKAVDAASHFVYQHAQLNPNTLTHFGYRSCRIQYLFQKEPLRIEAGTMLLLEAAGECQRENPGERYNNRLRECLRDRSDAIAERVRLARITVKE